MLKLKTMFEPKTMAAIGVSMANDRHPANIIYNKTHLRYPLKVFAVNPGGVLVDQLVKFVEQGVGVSMAVSIGNKALIREKTLLEHLVGDPKTNVIAFYIEGFSQNEGRDFVMAASQSPKPVVVLKAGKTAEDSRAVSSRTASLAGDHEVFSVVMTQHGVIEAINEFELVSFCESLSCYPKAISGHVGIISGSGAHGWIFLTGRLPSSLKLRRDKLTG